MITTGNSGIWREFATFITFTNTTKRRKEHYKSYRTRADKEQNSVENNVTKRMVFNVLMT